MPAGKYNLLIEKGATFDPIFTWYTQNQAGTRTPVNLATYTARAQIRKTIRSEDAEVEFSTTNGKITLGGSAGTIQLLLTAAETSALTFTSGVWDLELEAPSGKVTKLLKGDVSVRLAVTR